MTAQGWSEGKSLGSTTSTHHARPGKDENAARLAAAKVGVIFKDDNLGLGAKLRSKDVEGQKTGMDAFMGLLGRLNAKGEVEEREVERKEGERRLEGYVRGRWGGMMFVPGGVLVGGEEFGTKKAAREAVVSAVEGVGRDEVERTKRKEEKRARKEARRVRREAKAERRAKKSKSATQSGDVSTDKETSRSTSRSQSRSDSKYNAKPAPDEPVSSEDSGVEDDDSSKRKKRKRSATSTPILEGSPAGPPRPMARNGRQLLRGRNIEAKRRAFQDARGLDGIFMKAAAS